MRPGTCATFAPIGLTLVVVAGCGGPPASEFAADEPSPAGLYVDWDRADWLVDRSILVNVRDFTVAQNLGRRDPVAEYRVAITYAAEWDSLGLIPFLALNEDEQADRRRLARKHLAEARRVALGTLGHYREAASRGFLPNLNLVDNAPIPPGAETAVTTAIRHLTTAAGLDPSHPAAWRDLAYFSGVVGDRRRQQRALDAALAALDRVDSDHPAEGDLGRLRRDIVLDLAWLARDLGQPQLTLAYLDHVEPWLATPSPERDLRRFEARLLRGLALADRGDWLAAIGVARDLPRTEVLSRTPRGGARESLRWFLGAPNLLALGYDRANWPRQVSDFGRRWIKALAGAPSGDSRHTLWLLGSPPTDLEFPPRLAARYWQDQGRVYARAGDHESARHCFEWSAMYRPFLAFFPIAGSRGPSRLGAAEASQRYFTAYGMFFLCGDRGAYDRDAAATVAERPRPAAATGF
ncbi:MAG TPA: hypothetical protein PLL30_12475 [Candidatus Krumholzibacteria bacterium]|nr:hypothetical protein [Candidatus Krumholzibacteria bacterium]HPD72584.1 hypothetical protein [Candidatus Krumholzibacteria bacterium]HRY40484.1 hypothetical protein [Candidatus Krumholzibacteria bacterium]